MINIKDIDFLKSLNKKIDETGFSLEYEISTILEENDWIVNTGKYYIDDIEDKPREIDIIAYKIQDPQYISEENKIFFENNKICTMLIISCKKEIENNICCFYTKDKKYNEIPYINFITNNAFIKNLYLNDNLQQQYLDNIKNLEKSNIYQNIFDNKNVFASQVFKYENTDVKVNQKKNNRNPINKKDDYIIYNSIETLIKSMYYNINKNQNNTQITYFINLLTILDIENLLEVHFNKNNQRDINMIDNIKYNINYMVYKKDVTSNIHFIHKNQFQNILRSYNSLHNCNLYFFSKFSQCYSKIFNNIHYFMIYYNTIKNDLNEKLKEKLYGILHDKFQINVNDLNFIFLLINDNQNFQFWISHNILCKDGDTKKLNNDEMLDYYYNIFQLEVILYFNQDKDDIYSHEREIEDFLNEKNNFMTIKNLINKYFFDLIGNKNIFKIVYEYYPF